MAHLDEAVSLAMQALALAGQGMDPPSVPVMAYVPINSLGQVAVPAPQAGDTVTATNAGTGTSLLALQTGAVGSFAIQALAAAGAARDIAKFGVFFTSDGYTVKYDGTNMIYEWRNIANAVVMTLTAAGGLAMGLPITTKGYTVAGLPAGTLGMVAHVTDALAPAWNVALAGGGAIKVLAFYNGAAWVAA